LFTISGYSIFVVLGPLPPCEADKEILENPVVQTSQPKPVKEASRSVGYRLGSSADDEDLQKAIQLSLGEVIYYKVSGGKGV